MPEHSSSYWLVCTQASIYCYIIYSSYWLVCTQLSTNLSLAALQHPIILGSDKTVVSVATGHVKYHPVYLSIRLVHNTIRHGHQNVVIPIGFLAIPKCTSFYYIQWSNLIQLQADRKYNDDISFRKFKRQMYHVAIWCVWLGRQWVSWEGTELESCIAPVRNR